MRAKKIAWRVIGRRLGWLAAGWSALSGLTLLAAWPPVQPAGPYALSYDPENGSKPIDKPIPGYIGPEGDGVAPYNLGDGTILYTDQYVNPVFLGWATSVVNYAPADPGNIETEWMDPTVTIGPPSADVFGVVSLGDLSTADITAKMAPGSLVLGFATDIADGPGADFVVFGNAFDLNGVNSVFAKLAYVEVSSDGVNYVRFPSVDTNPKPAGTSWPYMTSDPTKIYNLFGKTSNSYGLSWGVPFDLSQLATSPQVVAGTLDLQHVRYVRLVAVVGNGSNTDAYGHTIYDPWLTTGSPGPEVQAIGVLHAPSSFILWSNGIANSSLRGPLSNPANDGVPNLLAYALGTTAGNATPASLRPVMGRDSSGRPNLTFPAPTATDVTLDVETSTSLSASATWTPIAQSVAGGAWKTLLDTKSHALAVVTLNGTSHSVTVAVPTPPAANTMVFIRLRATELSL